MAVKYLGCRLSRVRRQINSEQAIKGWLISDVPLAKGPAVAAEFNRDRTMIDALPDGDAAETASSYSETGPVPTNLAQAATPEHDLKRKPRAASSSSRKRSRHGPIAPIVAVKSLFFLLLLL